MFVAAHICFDRQIASRGCSEEQVLHPGRALPPLQKANSNYRDWVADSDFV